MSEETTISSNEYKTMIMILDGCCFRMGVEDPTKLYNAVKRADEAIRAFICDNDGGKLLKAWWDSREF
jgi:hypothetical protein